MIPFSFIFIFIFIVIPILLGLLLIIKTNLEKKAKIRERIKKMTPTERSEELTRIILTQAKNRNENPQSFNPVRIENIQSTSK